MGLSSRGSPAAPPSRTIVEVIEGPLFSAGSPRALLRGASQSVGDQPFYDTTVGGPFVYNAGNGLRGWRLDPAADAVIGKQAKWLQVPLDRRAGVAPIEPAGDRIDYRSTFSAVAFIEAMGTGQTPFIVALNNGLLPLDYSTGQLGYELCSRPTLNGGNWSVRRRRTSGGAIEEVQDTGLSPLVPRRLSFQHTDSDAPRLVIEIDGQAVYTASAAAHFPVLAAGDSTNLFAPAICHGLSPGAVAGRIGWVLRSRFTLEEV